MWYFIIRQPVLDTPQYKDLQKMAGLTEVIQFNEPHGKLYQFEVERATYPAFVDYLDLNGIQYTTYPDRPERATLLAEMP